MIDFWYYKETGDKITCLDDLCKILNVEDRYNLYGFTYKLELSYDNKIYYYIGKKNFFYLRESKAKVDKLPRLGHIKFKRKKIPTSTETKYNHDEGKKITKVKKYKYVEYEIYKKESDWLTYEGSFQRTEEVITVKKNIIDIAESKRLLTYLECKELFASNAIISPYYINSNILGRFFRDSIMLPDPDQDYNNPDLASNGVYYATDDTGDI